jgi:hypothetical protein
MGFSQPLWQGHKENITAFQKFLDVDNSPTSTEISRRSAASGTFIVLESHETSILISLSSLVFLRNLL